MARVTHVRSAQKPQGSCEKCGKPIEVGTAYKWIKPRSHRGAVGYKRKRCETCPSWRPSETTSSTALGIAYAAQEDAEDAISNWGRDEHESLEEILSTLADGIREAAEAWRESAQAIEDGFGHSTYQSDELNEKADALESAADSLEADFEPWDEDEHLEEARAEALAQSDVPDEEHETYDWDLDPEGLKDVVESEIEAKREEWADEQESIVNDLISGIEFP